MMLGEDVSITTLAPLSIDRPLAFFDCETTGKFPERDRIVEITIIRYAPGGTVDRMSELVNPDCPIPADASAVHGITDNDVRTCPKFSEIAPTVAAFLAGCDLAGYNVVRFDVPLLVAEMRRANQAFSLDGRRVVDPYVIFVDREKRDLAAALRFFCGAALEGAHRAEADVEATVQVLLGQFARYDDLPRSVDALHELCNRRDPSWIDAGGKLVWSNGEPCIGFRGKAYGKSLPWLSKNDPGYLLWMTRADFAPDVQAIIRAALKGKFPTPPAGDRA